MQTEAQRGRRPGRDFFARICGKELVVKGCRLRELI